MSDVIKLGARNFEVRRLKLGQLRELLRAIGDMAEATNMIDGAVAVLVAGLVAGYPELTAEAILDTEADLDELNEAVATVIRVAGLQPRGEAAPQPATA